MKTVTLETAKRMKELGWPQEAEKWWQATYSRSIYMTGYPCYEQQYGKGCEESPDCHHPVAWHIACYCEPTDEGFDIAAPTLDEILEALPEQGVELFQAAKEFKGKPLGGWYVRCRKTHDLIHADNPTEATALLWCRLKEEGLTE